MWINFYSASRQTKTQTKPGLFLFKFTSNEDYTNWGCWSLSNGAQVFKRFQINRLDDPDIKIHSSPFYFLRSQDQEQPCYERLGKTPSTSSLRLQIIAERKIRPTRYPALQIHTTVSVQRVTGFYQLISVIKIHPVLPSLHDNTITSILFFQGHVPFNSEKLKCGLAIKIKVFPTSVHVAGFVVMKFPLGYCFALCASCFLCHPWTSSQLKLTYFV